MDEAAFDKALAELGWTQADLARKLGVAPETISRMRKRPWKYVEAYLEAMLSLKRLQAIAARALRV